MSHVTRKNYSIRTKRLLNKLKQQEDGMLLFLSDAKIFEQDQKLNRSYKETRSSRKSRAY